MPYSNQDDERDYDRAWKRVNYRRKRYGAALGVADIFMERCRIAAEEVEQARREARRGERERED